MKNNLPVTNREQPFSAGIIVTRTDLKGIITHANDLFVEVSGFSRDELIGQNHNIVRHPDMPPAAFADLWQKMKAGQPWRGLVKNRCKNGDYYWVDAFVIPTKKNGQTSGYMSVRQPAKRENVAQASRLYEDMRNSRETLPRARPIGRHDKLIRYTGSTVIATSLVALGWHSQDIIGYAVAGTALAIQAGLACFEAAKRQDFARLRGICLSIAEGRLNHDLAIHQQGECGELEEALAYMQVHLKVVIDDLQMSARTLAHGTGAVHDSLEDIYRRMDSGTVNITQMSAAIEQLSASIEQVASHAHDTSQLSTKARDSIHLGEQGMAASHNNGIMAMQAVESAQSTIKSLADAITKITPVTQTIREIAEQTNLLALNAAIEAARAGEQGRGFAVVADEVRKLAERTSTSTGLINDMVANVNKAASSTISTMETITDTTRTGVQTQQVTAHQLEAIKGTTVQVHDMMQDVASTNTQQAIAAGELSSRMADITVQIAESHRHVEQASGVVAQIASQSKQLAQLANHFEVH